MAETPANPAPAGKTMRVLAGVTSMTYCLVLITCIVVWGVDGNSLHASALAWAFAVYLCVLGGVGFPAVGNVIDKVRGNAHQ